MEILASLLRQYLEATDFDLATEKQLSSLLKYSTIDLHDLITSYSTLIGRPHLMIIDGVDDCPEPEQIALLKALAQLSSVKKIKIFLTTRDSMYQSINELLSFHHLSTDSPIAQPSLLAYIDIFVEEAHQTKRLAIGNHNLLSKIKQRLKSEAKGMSVSLRFLWVAFQLEDMCAQTCDEDILQVLKNLPRDLPETYTRITTRILKSPQFETMRSIFGWVIAAKEPLTLPQLREAIAIQPCQPYTIPERLRNDMPRVIGWSRGLLILDEEDMTAQFTHPSVKQFLLSGSMLEQGFRFQESELNLMTGEICVTYLNFSDFERALVKQHKNEHQITPEAILSNVLKNEVEHPVSTMAQKLWRMKTKSKASRLENTTRIMTDLAVRSMGVLSTTELSHPFLDYASRFWLAHTAGLGRSNQTYKLWLHLLSEPNSHATLPWNILEWVERDRKVSMFICEHDHAALLEYIESSQKPFSEPEMEYLILHSLRKLSKAVIFSLLHAKIACLTTIQRVLNPFLPYAVLMGYLNVVEYILLLGANPNESFPEAQYRQHVKQQTHLDIFEVLTGLNLFCSLQKVSNRSLSNLEHLKERLKEHLKARLKERFNRLDTVLNETTVLSTALKQGCVRIAVLLIDTGAWVNGIQDRGIYSLLGSAIKRCDVTAIKLLLEAGADADSEDFEGVTALFTAIYLTDAEEHHVHEVTEQLINAGASVNEHQAGSLFTKDFTPLAAAVEKGFETVCRLLLKANANPDVDIKGSSPLVLAVESKKGGLVESLLAGGADCNYPYDSRRISPLLAAVSEGDHATIAALLESGASVNWQVAARLAYIKHTTSFERSIGPLLKASASGNSTMVLTLFVHGANPCNYAAPDEAQNAFYLGVLGRRLPTKTIRTMLGFSNEARKAAALALYRLLQQDDSESAGYLASEVNPYWSPFGDKRTLLYFALINQGLKMKRTLLNAWRGAGWKDLQLVGGTISEVDDAPLQIFTCVSSFPKGRFAFELEALDIQVTRTVTVEISSKKPSTPIQPSTEAA